jgi:chitin synthase
MTPESVKEMLDSKESGEPIVNLHMKNDSPSEWVTRNTKKNMENSLPHVNFFFCAKHKNVGKIESHMWFFKGFCTYLNPTYCQMLDVGTIPKYKAISGIIKAMEKEEEVGGACGEIEVFEPSKKELGYPFKVDERKKRLSCLERTICCKRLDGKRSFCQWLEGKVLFHAQYVEYKVSHYIDKKFESMFGFVSVLPGAFCTFRWEAIEGDPLNSFFKGMNSDSHTASEANMYLAEDRVMCLEILRKLSKNWILRYIPGCIALTDPPMSFLGFIKQRRRWTNGSLFASWYVIEHLHLINRSSHSKFRRCGFLILYLYMIFTLIFSLILVGSLFATFYIFSKSFFNELDSEMKKHISGYKETDEDADELGTTGLIFVEI